MSTRAAFFREERWTAGVVGLGYVGLPLSISASVAGLDVIGFDVSEERVSALSSGRSHVEDVTDDELQRALDNGARFTTEESDLEEADAIFVAVPSPLGRSRQPDMSYIEAAAETVGRVARSGQLVSLESTTYPGTTEEYFLPALERAGLVLDEDVYLCFSPERVDPGNVLHTSDIPKVVGGVTEESGEVAAAAYQRFVSKIHVVKSARAAELTKLLENTYRAVNIALVNEMAQVAHVFDIDIWEVVEAAATKPFGFQAFYPGPGVGGHCIPLDPQFLAWRAREMRVATRFIDLAEDVNLHMPEFVARRIFDELNGRGLPVFGTRILGVGLAYKRNVSDDRESPALDVLRLLERRGAQIGVLDPHVPDERIEAQGFQAVPPEASLSTWTMAVVLTDHDEVDYERLVNEVEVVFDTRGVFRRLGLANSNVVTL
ncbi:MAG: nucleotide sugar dehydrogenase [Nitriliruptorales bacterium]|nr:nucleotide sugar dehydrogenase [Nitriliruptorales bacterium]